MAAPLRVALVSEYYYPDVGGIPEHLHHLAGALARRGHAVTIVTTSYPGAPDLAPAPAGVSLRRLGRSSRPVITNGSVSRAAVGLGLGAQVRAALRGFDLVHVHGPLFPVLPLLAIRHAPETAALVATLHTSFPGSLVMRALRRPLQRYLDALDAVIAVSESACASLLAMGLRLGAAVIPNGVDLDYWAGGRPLPALRTGPPCLLVQARLEPRNRVGALVGALARLPPGALRLLIVGDGPMRAELEARVPPPLRPHVWFLGARVLGRDDLARSSVLYAFTADIASCPLSLLEGMAAGLGVVSHDIDGARQLLRDGVEGLLVPVGDEARWAEALRALLLDEELRRRLGAGARRRAQGYAWPLIAARVEEVYRAAQEERIRRMSSRIRREPPPSRYRNFTPAPASVR